MGVAISCRGLGKRYRLGRRERYRALRDVISEGVRGPFRRRTSDAPSIWALRDLDLDIRHGEVVGIIGRNGAGKSTLLKILSRITEPTAGSATIRGRVGSLLEVGTGFHPELTGRENIFLNGAILGMKKAEIARKFDAIVAFAEIERFLDTPVKHYSSGMYVRLAFAVAAHLEPEILLVDEVLAVGDAAFQKKCLGKMDEIAHEGRTVVLVSHTIAAIRSLCERAVWIDAGQAAAEGAVARVLDAYMQASLATDLVPLEKRSDRDGDGPLRLVSLQIRSTEPGGVVRSDSRLDITIGYSSPSPVSNARFLVGIYDYTNAGIFFLDTDSMAGFPSRLPKEGLIRCVTEPINLTPGPCYANVAALTNGGKADHVERAGQIDVEPAPTGPLIRTPDRTTAICVLTHQWTLLSNSP